MRNVFLYFLLLCAATGYSQVNRYDVNNDGSVNSADVVAVYNHIIYGMTCPNANHPHAIDLGLPSGTKWSCCNIGSDLPEQYGGFYAWGEIEEKDNYSISNYEHYDGLSYSYVNIGDSIAGTEWDVAHKTWSDGWQMPTLYQFRELYYRFPMDSDARCRW